MPFFFLFYTDIFPSWRSAGRELWPTSIRLSLSMYYGKMLDIGTFPYSYFVEI